MVYRCEERCRHGLREDEVSPTKCGCYQRLCADCKRHVFRPLGSDCEFCNEYLDPEKHNCCDKCKMVSSKDYEKCEAGERCPLMQRLRDNCCVSCMANFLATKSYGATKTLFLEHERQFRQGLPFRAHIRHHTKKYDCGHVICSWMKYDWYVPRRLDEIRLDEILLCPICAPEEKKKAEEKAAAERKREREAEQKREREAEELEQKNRAEDLEFLKSAPIKSNTVKNGIELLKKLVSDAAQQQPSKDTRIPLIVDRFNTEFNSVL